MTAFLRRVLCLVAVGLIDPNLCGAQATDESTHKSLDGYLGAGPMVLPKYVGSADSETNLMPIANIEYKETAYIYLNRVGVRLWSSGDKKMALGIAAEPRFGFKAGDGERLAGMSTRRDAIEGGPAFEWELPWFSLSAAYFTDWSNTSGGQSWRLSVDRQLVDNGHWDISTYLDLDRADASIVQYYFGVRPDEATATRPSYQPGATVMSDIGLFSAYKINKNYALLFGGELDYLGRAAADSPIVQQRTGVIGYFGLGLVF
ncbi:MAG TPA: MipA/OmpV family protein [Candidatus Methylomirabilis sp.]|nr:MipA/OmpV family protein [Candidatus Methylomirabilis sp.]